jgi:hypothetical protein
MRVDSAAGQVGQGSTGECFQGVFASCGIPSLSNCHEGLEREDSPPIINKLMRHVNDSTIRHFGSVINVNAGGAVLLWNLAQTPDGFETVEVHKHSQLEDWRPMIEVRPPTTAALRWSALSDCMHYGAPRAPSDSLCVMMVCAVGALGPFRRSTPSTTNKRHEQCGPPRATFSKARIRRSVQFALRSAVIALVSIADSEDLEVVSNNLKVSRPWHGFHGRPLVLRCSCTGYWTLSTALKATTTRMDIVA